MSDFKKNIEKSARKIFRIFLKSRLYSKTRASSADELLCVELPIFCGGRKKMSLFMEKNTIGSIAQKLSGGPNSNSKEVSYKVLGEMAYMIAGSALCRERSGVRISSPKRAKSRAGLKNNTMNFSSKYGRFGIVLEDM